MRIEAWKKYRTRDGRVALVGAVNGTAEEFSQVVGWIDGEGNGWRMDGRNEYRDFAEKDLIAEYREPREWWVYPDDMALLQAYGANKGAEGRILVREVVGDDK